MPLLYYYEKSSFVLLKKLLCVVFLIFLFFNFFCELSFPSIRSSIKVLVDLFTEEKYLLLPTSVLTSGTGSLDKLF